MRAVRADAHGVLQPELVVVARTRLVARVLQAQTTELAVGPVDHEAQTLWIVVGKSEARSRKSNSRVVHRQGVETAAEAPLGKRLVNALRVPSTLVDVVRQHADAGQRIRAILVTPQVFALENEVPLAPVPLRSPLPDELRDGRG